MKSLLVVGNVCKDVIYQTEHYPAEDSKAKACSKEVRMGGNAANILQVLPQLTDIPVDCCIKVGTCQFSEHVKTELGNCGVRRVLAVSQPGTSLPESLIVHAKDSSTRTCINYRGGCQDLTTDEVLSLLEDIGQYQWVHLEHRRNGYEVLKLAKTIKSLHPDAALSIDIEALRDGFTEMLGVVDYPIVSKDVCKLLGYTSILDSLTNLSQYARNALIVTWAEMGAGVWLSEKIDNLTLSNDKQNRVIDDHIFVCDAVYVDNIVDSIGAGDSFTAGFISSSLNQRNKNISNSLVFACEVAASKLQNHGMVIHKDFKL